MIALKNAAVRVAALAVVAGLLLPSAAMAQKAQFDIKKPHTNVGSQVGTPGDLIGPPPVLPPPNPPSQMGKPLSPK